MNNLMKLKLQLFANMDVGTTYTSPVVNIKPKGYPSGSGYDMKFTVRLNSQDLENNISNITVTSYMRTRDNSWGWRKFGSVYMERSMKVNDEVGYTLLSKTQISELPTDNAWNWVNCGSANSTVHHNENGQATIYIRNRINTSEYTTSYLPIDTTMTSEELVLKTLHKVPDEISYTITEINPILTAINVANNTFVKNLSIKNISITATTYDEATKDNYKVYNNATSEYFENTTSPVTCDYTMTQSYSKALLYDSATNKTKIKVGVVDSKNAEGISETTEYDVIPYEKILINDATTDVERIGQVSGNVSLNVEGTYFNGQIGTVNQGGTYKPTIKYKYWRTGTTEPSTYDNTIPSSNITINNGIFSVSNYNIGSDDETDPNYFDGRYAYKVKIQVIDNFFPIESLEKSIFVGEPVWSEYSNRVDFKALTRQNKQIYPDLYVLDTDVVIGEFDGEPLYRRVVHPTPTAARTTPNHGIVNLKQIIKAYGTFKRNNNTEQQSPIPNNYTNWEIYLYDVVASGTYTLYFSSNQWGAGVKDVYIIFEFTKTTD